MHEWCITMDIVYMRCKCQCFLSFFSEVRVFGIHQDLTPLDTFRMQSINVLSCQERFKSIWALSLSTVLLEILDCNMACIRLNSWCITDLEKVVMPLPISLWMLSKECLRTYFCWVFNASVSTCILVLPETFLSSECWDTTSSWDTSTCQDSNFLAT